MEHILSPSPLNPQDYIGGTTNTLFSILVLLLIVQVVGFTAWCVLGAWWAAFKRRNCPAVPTVELGGKTDFVFCMACGWVGDRLATQDEPCCSSARLISPKGGAMDDLTKRLEAADCLIEKDIPTPDADVLNGDDDGYVYPFREMEPGDSFYVRRHRANVERACDNYIRVFGIEDRRFITKNKEYGVRVWCVEAPSPEKGREPLKGGGDSYQGLIF